jgi:hypothetical protein
MAPRTFYFNSPGRFVLAWAFQPPIAPTGGAVQCDPSLQVGKGSDGAVATVIHAPVAQGSGRRTLHGKGRYGIYSNDYECPATANLVFAISY